LGEVGITAQQLQRLDKAQTNTAPQPVQKALWQRISRLSSPLWGAVLAFATLTGFWLFWPKISIDPYVSQDPHDPFAQQFVYQNNSVYALHDLTARCDINNVANSKFLVSGFSLVGSPSSHLDTLEPDAKQNATCDLNAMMTLDKPYSLLQIGVVIDYRLPLGFRRCKESLFSGKRTADSSYIWTYQGTTKCSPGLSR
jgi:hypothetical protein